MRRLSRLAAHALGCTILVACVFVTIAVGAKAAEIPRPSIVAMCEQADAVVECTQEGDGTFNVSHVFKLRAGSTIGRVIEVPYFVDHPPVFWNSGGSLKEAKPLPVDRVLLFLQRTKSSEWAPLGEAVGGALGVVWMDGEQAYWYVQFWNPGGLRLWRREEGAPLSRGLIVHDDPLEEVKIGVVDSQRWQGTLAVAGPEERADALARYLIKRTSPARDFHYFAELARRRLESEFPHGPHAVVDAIHRANQDGRLDHCVQVLTRSFWRMRVRGHRRLLERSVNALIPLIGDTDRANQTRLISGFSLCASPDPLYRLRRVPESSENAELAKRVIARIEEDLEEAKANTSSPTDE